MLHTARVVGDTMKNAILHLYKGVMGEGVGVSKGLICQATKKIFFPLVYYTDINGEYKNRIVPIKNNSESK